MVNYESLENASKEELISMIKSLDEGMIKAFDNSQELVKQNANLKNGLNKACGELVKVCRKLKVEEKYLDINFWKRHVLS